MTKNNSKIKIADVKENLVQNQVHEWRLCGIGEHWVRTHPMRIPPSKAHPNGYITTRKGHCASNPSGHHDQLHFDEIEEISNNFKDVNPQPCPLEWKFKGAGNKYDNLIAGWTKYWNDVLKPSNPLAPNIVKALIASESSFNPKILANKKNPTSARGLTQLTDLSRKILGVMSCCRIR